MEKIENGNSVERDVFDYEDYYGGGGGGNGNVKARVDVDEDANEDEPTPAIPDTLSPLTEDMKLFPDGVQIPLQLHYIRLYNTLYKVTEISDKTFLQYCHVRIPTSQNNSGSSNSVNQYNNSNTAFTDALSNYINGSNTLV